MLCGSYISCYYIHIICIWWSFGNSPFKFSGFYFQRLQACFDEYFFFDVWDRFQRCFSSLGLFDILDVCLCDPEEDDEEDDEESEGESVADDDYVDFDRRPRRKRVAPRVVNNRPGSVNHRSGIMQEAVAVAGAVPGASSGPGLTQQKQHRHQSRDKSFVEVAIRSSVSGGGRQDSLSESLLADDPAGQSVIVSSGSGGSGSNSSSGNNSATTSRNSSVDNEREFGRGPVSMGALSSGPGAPRMGSVSMNNPTLVAADTVRSGLFLVLCDFRMSFF